MQKLQLPMTRRSLTHKVKIHAEDGPVTIYFTVGLQENGQPAELFIKEDKEGASLGGMLKSWALAVSMLFRAGYTVEDLFSKFAFIRHQPAGFTEDPYIRNCTSIEDYVMRWMKNQFVKEVV